MTNNKQKTLSRQQKDNPRYKTVSFEKLKVALEDLSDSQRMVLDCFVSLSKRYRSIYPSQISIAAKIGLCRAQVNRIVTQLEALGLIKSQQRWNDSCLYWLSKELKNYHGYRALSQAFYGLKSALNRCRRDDVTLLVIKEDYLIDMTPELTHDEYFHSSVSEIYRSEIDKKHLSYQLWALPLIRGMA